MKAVVATKYGPPEVLVFKEFDKPIPKDNEVLIKIFATSGHIGDSRMRRFDIPGGFIIQILARVMLGFSGPSRIAKNSVLGMDLAGEIEEVLTYFFRKVECRVLGLTRSLSFYQFFECRDPDLARCSEFTGRPDIP